MLIIFRNILILPIFITIMLSACESKILKDNVESISTVFGTGIGAGIGYHLGNKYGAGYEKTAMIAGGALLGGYLGNRLGNYLESKDRETHIQTTNKALSTGRNQSWKNPDTKTSGRSEIINSKNITQQASIPVLKDKIKKVPPLDFIGESYRVTSSSNIRSGPGTNYRKVGKIGKGDIINVVGKVQGENWYMVSNNGVGSGFISTSLLNPAPSNALVTSQQPIDSNSQIEIKTVNTLTTCRTVKQTITLKDGSEKEDEIKACKGLNGWEVVDNV